ncbi:hypothetical protein ACERK3_08595 [Phycisphaerales bacterium AB-hyl4]|uniref:TFIIB-type zinc ribbon-containing protein n=1 Tax=Natronomicrosphaera hydrolytica TaxID=3242702 RepID=A0ABV4U5Y6_9BACT
MAKHLKCDCGTIFQIPEPLSDQSFQCPACDAVGRIPKVVVQRDTAGDTSANFSLCDGCKRVRTVGGILCQACTYQAYTGQRMSRGFQFWMIPVVAAGVLLLLGMGMFWRGLIF